MSHKLISGVVFFLCGVVLFTWLAVDQKPSKAGSAEISKPQSSNELDTAQGGTSHDSPNVNTEPKWRRFGSKASRKVEVASKACREHEDEATCKRRGRWIVRYENFLADAQLSGEQRQRLFSRLYDGQEHLKEARNASDEQWRENSTLGGKEQDVLYMAASNVNEEIKRELGSVLDERQMKLVEIHFGRLDPILNADIFVEQ